MNESILRDTLLQHINLHDVNRIVEWVSCNDAHRELLWRIALDGNGKSSDNALWIISHLPEEYLPWLVSKRNELIAMLLSTREVTKKRLVLQLLRHQEYSADDVRTDLLDYCLSKINAECEPYAIRCFSIYVAFKLCRHYPELISELQHHLSMLSHQNLSPGLKSALQQTKARIARLSR